MNKLLIIITTLSLFTGCTSKNTSTMGTSENEAEKQNSDKMTEKPQDFSVLSEMLVDSLLYFRHHQQLTDILSRNLPDITRDQSAEIQLRMLDKELAAGARLIGWKMGGTITKEEASYDPTFGYMLDTNVIKADSVVSNKNFPGGKVAVEGEIGFVMKKDFVNGVESIEELKAGIDYIVGAVEFAQSIAIPIDDRPETINGNHIMACGTGQAGIIIGSKKISVEEFDMEKETVKCFINDELVAEGISGNVFGTPIHALQSLANLLPKHGKYLKKGDVVVTGSLYQNPIIDSTSNVRLDFTNLGTIGFKMK